MLRIAVPSPIRDCLDYLPPEAGPAAPSPGVRVRVPLGRRSVVGVVVAHAGHSTLPRERLRPVTAVLDRTPVLPADLLALAAWMTDYYQHPPGEVLALFLPPTVRRGETTAGPRERVWALTEAGRGAQLPRAPARRRALDALEARGGVAATAELAADGVRPETLRQLARIGLVEAGDRPRSPAGSPPAVPTPAPPPTPEQAAARDAVARAGDRFAPFLLEGVTGSGKTEVYLGLARRALDAGRQVLLLVPEIGLTPQTLARVRARFPEPVAVLHSGLAAGARLAAWRDAASGRARILVGTRSAVLAPLPELGLVIVDEEHDESYKQQDGVRYSARDVAVKRAADRGVPVLLGSATPSLESLENARSGRYGLLRLTSRAGGARPPVHRLVDLRRDPGDRGLARATLDAVAARIAAEEQVLVFLNRRGYAPVLHCADCGWTAECPRCDARLTLHRSPAQLRCHHCGHEALPPGHCPACGAPEPMPVGLGTQRTEALLRERFPETPVLRIDRDAVRGQARLEAVLGEIGSGRPAILLGTQMLTKGHHFPAVTLVVVVDADAGLFSADFRAGERLAQQLVQVAGRAGRADRPGEVLVQTRHPEDERLGALLGEGYGAFAARILEERRSLGFPPFGRLALLRAEAPRPEPARVFLEAAARELRAAAETGLAVLGPVTAPMERRAGRFRAQLLLRAARRAPLHATLAVALRRIDALPEARRVRWSLDVDPLDTF